MCARLGDIPMPAKPPVACSTRWAGQLVTLRWVVQSKKALKLYDRLPATNTAKLDDGSSYEDHVMVPEDWEVAEQMVLWLRCQTTLQPEVSDNAVY
jgi:hypothetical protein